MEFLPRIEAQPISKERKEQLTPIIEFLQKTQIAFKETRMVFICTHNSRRSLLSQVWAQAMAHHFNAKNVLCYSAGTEATALYPLIADTLSQSGFEVHKMTEGNNPIYNIKYAENEHPVIGFSKRLDDTFNPSSKFAAFMTCSQADEHCPFIPGAEARFSMSFEDPKLYDDTPQQVNRYQESSIKIASELFYVFSNICSSK